MEEVQLLFSNERKELMFFMGMINDTQTKDLKEKATMGKARVKRLLLKLWERRW